MEALIATGDIQLLDGQCVPARTHGRMTLIPGQGIPCSSEGKALEAIV